MGVYKKAVITEVGEALVARAVSGEVTIQFSNAVTSSYTYSEGTNLKKLTELQEVKQTVIPSNVQIANDTLISIRTMFDNSEITQEYLIQNVGIYASDGETEILFAICQATTPDQMPAFNGVAPSSFIYNVQISIAQAEQLSISINTAGAATVQDVHDLEKKMEEKKLDSSGGDASDTVVKSFETSKEEFPIPEPGENSKTLWGKVKKFSGDIKAWMTGVCLLGHIVNNCVTNNPNLPLSAAQGKALMDLYTVLNTKQNESAATIEKLWNGNHVINELPDDTSPDEIVDDGYYSVYTSIKGKRYRWILHNKAVVAASQVYYRIQTAYYYMGAGSAYNILPLQRNIYYTGSVFGYTEWHEI